MQQQPHQDTSDPPPTTAFSHFTQDPSLNPHQSRQTGGGAESSGSRRRVLWEQDEDQAMLEGRQHIPQVEKSKDDVNSPPSSSRAGIARQESTTLTTLSRLFAVSAPLSPETSRHPSYIQPSKSSIPSYNRSQIGDAASLPDHLYTRGLLEGRHSDITVYAFGQAYKLHRLILDRAPFFRSALSEPWLESHAKETTIHPEDIDASITQSSFELALKRLYGFGSLREEDHEAVGLFATGCWLEMADLVESSIESMLRQMTPQTLSPLIKLVTSNYYGRAGDKILASAKAMLCRDGWKMPLRYWDGIPGDIVREIVGGDGFFVDGEWERWALAKTILDRRLKKRALEAGLTEQSGRRGKKRAAQKAPEAERLMAVRFDSVYRRNGGGNPSGLPKDIDRWISLYTHSEIEPILVLLDEGIHYLHLDFEHLQFIRNAKDILGLPVMPEKVVGTALWQQMELRQKVMNARESDMELNLSTRCAEDNLTTNASHDTSTTFDHDWTPSSSTTANGKQKASDAPNTNAADRYADVHASESWDGNGKPRKFWIPTSDCNIVMGGNADPVIATSNNTTLQRNANRWSGTMQPEDYQWMSDFTAVTSQPRLQPQSSIATLGEGGNQLGGGVSMDGGVGGNSTGTGGAAGGEVRYTHFPPFRFAAEFPNPRLLKEKKRVYSRTVFYAGSLWNIYIQKVASSRSKQLGVYLHRAKEREVEDGLAAASGTATLGLQQGVSSVDERIGQLEREMILRSERRERRLRRQGSVGGAAELVGGDGEDVAGDSSDFEGETAAQEALAPTSTSSRVQRSTAIRNMLERTQASNREHRNSGQQTEVIGTSPPSASGTFATSSSTADYASDPILTPDSDNDSASSSESDSESADRERSSAEAAFAPSKLPRIPTIPAYVDQRPTIKTYFKIYSPSRGGRMLSVYESAPDRFNFSQSWGWKSSTLMLDEGMVDTDLDGGAGEGGDGEKVGAGGDGRLRFMVVIGNI